MIINTGSPRSIKGHAISGTLMGFMMSGVREYSRYKQGVISKDRFLQIALKSGLEGGIIASSGIAAANALGDTSKKPSQNILEAVACVALGFASVYGVSQLFKDLTQGEK